MKLTCNYGNLTVMTLGPLRSCSASHPSILWRMMSSGKSCVDWTNAQKVWVIVNRTFSKRGGMIFHVAWNHGGGHKIAATSIVWWRHCTGFFDVNPTWSKNPCLVRSFTRLAATNSLLTLKHLKTNLTHDTILLFKFYTTIYWNRMQHSTLGTAQVALWKFASELKEELPPPGKFADPVDFLQALLNEASPFEREMFCYEVWTRAMQTASCPHHLTFVFL